MKTSNKIITAAAICIFLGIVTYTFMMRGAYQEAIKNPVSSEVKIGLKTVKYLNITYDDNIIFQKGNKFEITVNRVYKDSLTTDYQNDTLNLDISKLGEVTIHLPDFPVINFARKEIIRYKDNVAIDEAREDYRTIFVPKNFQSGNFIATFLNDAILNFDGCRFDKIDVKSQENVVFRLIKSDIQQLNLNLGKSSLLDINYSSIKAKNLVLSDSCEVKIRGKEARGTFLK
jgi:hypothetical protein